MKMTHSTTGFAILISVLVACSSFAGLAVAQTQGPAPAVKPSSASPSDGAPRSPGVIQSPGMMQGRGIMGRPGMTPYCPGFDEAGMTPWIQPDKLLKYLTLERAEIG
jgi:hypothetical protein